MGDFVYNELDCDFPDYREPEFQESAESMEPEIPTMGEIMAMNEEVKGLTNEDLDSLADELDDEPEWDDEDVPEPEDREDFDFDDDGEYVTD